ncbi:hypothetical protein ACO22_05289 [Paracoccidioides brasiliensis]|uniref:Uncharacterized protein n=1 Tax=Paracoccidioides brasiliensis TaxID=121759 RepID=A0A1D2JAN4_PARBR|nr:hypothetical protein ACO22_05289 [Paracoccidioides brasiliensis]
MFIPLTNRQLDCRVEPNPARGENEKRKKLGEFNQKFISPQEEILENKSTLHVILIIPVQQPRTRGENPRVIDKPFPSKNNCSVRLGLTPPSHSLQKSQIYQPFVSTPSSLVEPSAIVMLLEGLEGNLNPV